MGRSEFGLKLSWAMCQRLLYNNGMTDLTLQVPERLAQEFTHASQEFATQVLELGLRAWKIEQALQAYARGGLTLGAAAHLAGLAESEMARQAYAYGLEPRFSPETLAEELAPC